MRRRLGYLTLPLLLLAFWLLLNDSFSAGHLILGAVFAVVLSWLALSVRPLRASVRHPVVVLRLIWHVAVDIARSNIAVGRIVWLGERAHTKPGFLKIPLKIIDPHGLAALACIVTYTPGTVWSDYSPKGNVLTLHVLDLQDEAHWLHVIQDRYERPLIRIFE